MAPGDLRWVGGQVNNRNMVENAGVSRWARVGYSAVGFAVGIVSFSVWTTVAAGSTGQLNLIDPMLWLCLAASMFALPGWLLALPMVLLVKRVDGWRFWAIWAMGTAIGPVVLIGFDLREWLAGGRAGRLADFGSSFHWTGAWVAAVAALVYLLLVRRAQRRSE